MLKLLSRQSTTAAKCNCRHATQARLSIKRSLLSERRTSARCQTSGTPVDTWGLGRVRMCSHTQAQGAVWWAELLRMGGREAGTAGASSLHCPGPRLPPSQH